MASLQFHISTLGYRWNSIRARGFRGLDKEAWSPTLLIQVYDHDP